MNDMRKLTQKEINIRWKFPKVAFIESAYAGTYRGASYTIRNHRFGSKPWTLHVYSILTNDFLGFTHSYESRNEALNSVHTQIDAVLGKSIEELVAEVF
jgi:hypothetical protein